MLQGDFLLFNFISMYLCEENKYLCSLEKNEWVREDKRPRQKIYKQKWKNER